jgi:hypothetical protein
MPTPISIANDPVGISIVYVQAFLVSFMLA